MLTLGWKASPEQWSPEDLLDFAAEADRAGFDSIDVSDHFHPWSEEGAAPFTWTWLGAVAVQTDRIEIGTGLTCPILRYHPAVIAQAAATVDAMSEGRFYLGVGTGEALNEYAATGMWPEYDERQERLAEAIDLIRALWTGAPVTFKGKYYHTDKAKLYTLPSHEIPLYISTLVPDSANFAGRYGDGLITTGGEKPELYHQMFQNFEAGARQENKRPERMPRLIELNVAFTDDTQAAIEEQKKYWAGTFVPALFDNKIYTPALSAKNGQSVGADTIQRKVCISADPQKHVEFVQPYIDLGFTHIYFHSAQEDQGAFLEDYGREVLPRIREAIEARQTETSRK